jgi:hypothetical protein
MHRGKSFAALTGVFVSLAVVTSGLGAQTVPAAYFSAEGGLAAEPPQFAIRSNHGFTLAVGAGRYLSEHRAIEARLGEEIFGAPPQFIGAGGCPGQDPQEPCIPPHPSAVHIATLTGDFLWSGSRTGITPLLIIGTGIRYITEAPEQSPELRPLLEIGGGVTHSFRATRVGIEGRFQLAASSAGLPRWTVPVGIDVRLF